MSTVEMRVDIGESDGIPHPDGRITEYGLLPSVSGLSGIGYIDITGPDTINGDHEYQYHGPIEQLSDTQYQKLMEGINRSIANPPYYIVSGTWTLCRGRC